MDSEKKVASQPGITGSEADVNMLIYKAGKAVKHFIMLIGKAFTSLATGILLILLFLFRNILWILLGCGVGLGYGIYQLTKKGPEYYSEMTVKTNFSSSRALYNAVDYFNALIGTGDKDQVSQVFGIPKDKTHLLVSFSVKPVKSEMISADLYKEQFMQFDRSRKIRQDTFWTRIVKYEDFKKSLTELDYHYHTISAKATDPSIFPLLQQGIIKHISDNELLQQIRNRQEVSNRDEEKLIVSAIENIDTLRRAYNQRLMRGQGISTPNSNQLTILETTPDIKTPELDLYDKMLELQDELKRTRKRSVTEHDIIEVFSPFAPMGTKISWVESVWRFVETGLAVSIIILVAIFLYRSLLAFDAQRKRKNFPIQPENI